MGIADIDPGRGHSGQDPAAAVWAPRGDESVDRPPASVPPSRVAASERQVARMREATVAHWLRQLSP